MFTYYIDSELTVKLNLSKSTISPVLELLLQLQKNSLLCSSPQSRLLVAILSQRICITERLSGSGDPTSKQLRNYTGGSSNREVYIPV